MDLLVQNNVLFFFDLEVLAEALDVGLERLIFISKLRVEVLMEVQISLHVGHFAVPEVQFAALLLVVLLHEAHTAAHFLRL